MVHARQASIRAAQSSLDIYRAFASLSVYPRSYSSSSASTIVDLQGHVARVDDHRSLRRLSFALQRLSRLQLSTPAGPDHITTFEATRAQANLLTRNEYLRAGIGGTVASLFSQILACPIDVISQHMQLVGLTSPGKVQSGDNAELSEKKGSTSKSAQRQIRRIHVPEEIRNSNYQIFRHICRTLFYENATADPNRSHFSLRGFYRGYMISTFLFSLTSAIWWPSYYFYQRQMLKVESMFRK